MQDTRQRTFSKDIYIADAARTPFLKARGVPGEFAASDLAVSVCKELLLRNNIEPKNIDQVVAGCMLPLSNEANIARLIALRLGCGDKVPGWTVQRNCASGMQALDSAAQSIELSQYGLVLAGGTEVMSRSPLLYSLEMNEWLGRLRLSKTFAQKVSTAMQFRPRLLTPIIALLQGLSDPYKGLSMGQTAEELAYEFNIKRKEMDEFSLDSQRKSLYARDNAKFETEIVPLFSPSGKLYRHDDGIREDVNVDKLAKLKPVFDRYGNITAGNSSQITDGASFMLLASKDAVEKYNLKVRGIIKDIAWSALDPSKMGLGPAHAMVDLLTRNSMSISDIDYFEINEAFAAQVIACLKSWQDEKYCKDYLGLDSVYGSIPEDRLNIDGGAIALGHPVSATGARISTHILNILERKEARYGVASLCIGGGQGGAVLIERVGGLK